MKGYLAAPIFTERDRNFNSYLESEILKRCPELDLYLAQNNASINDKTGCANSADIYVGDITRLKEADILITIMSGDLPPIGSSYEVAYFCGLCEQDPRRRIIALYDDCREGCATYSEAKKDALISGIAENQFPYINLLSVGFVKKWGNIYNTSKELIDAVEREYKIGCDKVVSGIYKITNLKNGMTYIGQSKDIYKRFREHKQINNESYSIDRAINTYGSDYFKFEVIAKCKSEELQSKEQYWIDYYDSVENGYNTQHYSTNNINNPSWHNKIVYSYDLNGNFIESFPSITEGAIAINRSTAGILKCLRYNDNRHSSGNRMWFTEYVEKAKPYEKLPHGQLRTVYCYDAETRLFIQSYSSCSEASFSITGKQSSQTHISDVIKGQRKTCFGYLWADKYFERLPENYYNPNYLKEDENK